MNMRSELQEPGTGTVILCHQDDLVAGSGVCALLGSAQIALFWLPECDPPLYAIGNHDPLGGANVLSRGIVGDVNGELVVASPLYKQHYALRSGRCLEDPAVAVPVYKVQLRDGQVLCEVPVAA